MLCKECEYFFTSGANEGYCACSGIEVTGDHEEVDCVYINDEDL